MADTGKKRVYTPGAPAPVGPYSQAVLCGSQLFVSGQLGLDGSGNMPQTVGAQARHALENLTEVLREAGCTTDNVVRTTVYLADMDDFAEVNGVYASFFREPYPARVAIEVAGLPLGALVEIDAVAIRGKEQDA